MNIENPLRIYHKSFVTYCIVENIYENVFSLYGVLPIIDYSRISQMFMVDIFLVF